MVIPEDGFILAFAMIVDINRYTCMVRDDETGAIAQFTRDVLSGPIDAIEKYNGEIVGYMGDAILGLLPSAEDTIMACFAIAKDLDRQCEFLSTNQHKSDEDWNFFQGGPSIKIAVEYGKLDISTISSRHLGTQRLFAGNAINYASRISAKGSGNRCHIGPVAATMNPFPSYCLGGPLSVRGKSGESIYTFFQFDLSDIWIEGPLKNGKDSYWG
jgi:class 3 adenylate cyclase